MRLDKYLIKHDGLSRKQVLRLLNQGKVRVDGQIVQQRDFSVNEFNKIELANTSLKPHQQAYYLMLNKPAGVLSATQDDEHTTAIELIDPTFNQELHIAGRLDRASTGLLVLTNDGQWSRQLTEPQQKIPKRYLVETVYAISPDTQSQFEQGIYFKYEAMTTSPAQLEMLGESRCILTIYEGRYHQIKRMFAAVGNRVKSLHRLSMGQIQLDKNLKPGEYRALTQQEINSVRGN